MLTDSRTCGPDILLSTHCNTDHRGAKHSTVKHIAWLQDLDDSAFRGCRVGMLANGVMKMRIERLAERVDALQSVASERRHQIGFSSLDSFKDRTDRVVVRSVLRRTLNCPPEIVERLQQVPRQLRSRKLHRFFTLTLHLLADVLLLCQGVQQLVLRVGEFAL